MFRNVVTIAGMALLASSSLLADFSYQESSKITGGMMAGMMKVAGVFSKTAREPIESTVAVKGDRMVHRSKLHTSIIDLGSRTITDIDMTKKTYSVMTFEQMKQMMEQMSEQMKQKGSKNDVDMKFKVSAENTGNSREISGYNAKEMRVKMEMEGTDQKSGQKGGMTVSMNVWISSDVKGYGEVREFYKKMASELNWTPGGNPFMAQPEVAKGVQEAFKEVSKLDGTPVLQTMAMGPQGTEAPPDTAAAQQPAKEQQQEQPKSVGSALGGALGGRFGLGKRKKEEAPKEQSAGNANSSANAGALLEMTTEYTGFSTGAVDPSMFEVPAGFKKVEPEMGKRGR